MSATTSQPAPGQKGHGEGDHGVGSSTNPFTSSELKARVAAPESSKGESSTNPFSSNELKARAPAPADSKGEADQKSQTQTGHDIGLFRSPDQLSARLADLSLGARAVLSSPRALLRPSPTDGAIMSLDDSGPGQVLCVTQSSKEAWFSLSWQEGVSCDFYYDASGDGLVLKNVGSVSIRAAPMDDNGHLQVLRLREACVISPGPWRISSGQEASEAWTDLLLFSRRYVTEKSAPSALVGEAGLKRKNDSMLAGEPKRRTRLESGEDDRSVVLVGNPSKGNEKMAVATTSHPLLDLHPGQAVTIRSLIEEGPEVVTETRNDKESSDGEGHTSENYSITHLRNIVATKGACFVFRARHPVFGSTAVKVIRSLKDPPLVSIPNIAHIWQNEERLMRRVDHPSIIKMFGSDARLYCIYMEYLPYHDLAKWSNGQIGHFFSGTTNDAKRILGDMASALAYLQRECIMHNDIKPSNILYDRERGPTLIDFGLASSFPTATLCLGGTPWYVAPEIFERKIRPCGSDVFALGVTLLYVLGKVPLPDATERPWFIWSTFNDASQRQLMKRWLAKVNRVRGDLARTGIESVVGEMLAQEPEDRIPAREIMEMLE